MVRDAWPRRSRQPGDEIACARKKDCKSKYLTQPFRRAVGDGTRGASSVASAEFSVFGSVGSAKKRALTSADLGGQARGAERSAYGRLFFEAARQRAAARRNRSECARACPEPRARSWASARSESAPPRYMRGLLVVLAQAPRFIASLLQRRAREHYRAPAIPHRSRSALGRDGAGDVATVRAQHRGASGHGTPRRAQRGKKETRACAAALTASTRAPGIAARARTAHRPAAGRAGGDRSARTSASRPRARRRPCPGGSRACARRAASCPRRPR